MSWRDAFRRWREGARSTGRGGSGDDRSGHAPNRLTHNYEEWSAEQFEGLSDQAPIRQLVIGLDFGTSYTKVAIGEVRTAYAVPFMLTNGSVTYLLPTVLQWDGHNSDRLHLQSNAVEFTHIDRLKIRMLDGDTSIESRVHNAGYLALVLRHLRGWLMTMHRGTYATSRLDWLINVGLPTDTYFGSELAHVYPEIVEAAWRLSVRQGPITMAGAWAEFDDPPPEPASGALHPDKISPFPELAAEVAAYIRSPMRRRDLHVLMDVGAGTLDVAVFNVYQTEDEEPLLPVFAKSVTRHGTAYLMDARSQRVPAISRLGWSYQDRLPDANEIARQIEASESRIEEADEEFRNDVKRAVLEPVRYTREWKYPTSRRWEEEIPIIACGGGMASSYFEKIVNELIERSKAFRFYRLRFPRPETLHAPGAGDVDLDRLNVAYGLSFDPFDIAHTRAPDDIDDDPRDPNPPPYGQPFIDKDMV